MIYSMGLGNEEAIRGNVKSKDKCKQAKQFGLLIERGENIWH